MKQKTWLFICYAICILLISSVPGSGFTKLSILWASDKLVHFLEYTIFGFLVLFSQIFKSNVKRRILYCTFIMLSFPVIDELYQSLIPGRSTDHLDLIADYGGEITGVIIAKLFRYA